MCSTKESNRIGLHRIEPLTCFFFYFITQWCQWSLQSKLTDRAILGTFCNLARAVRDKEGMKTKPFQQLIYFQLKLVLSLYNHSYLLNMKWNCFVLVTTEMFLCHCSSVACWTNLTKFCVGQI